jgi:hypothetical protein
MVVCPTFERAEKMSTRELTPTQKREMPAGAEIGGPSEDCHRTESRGTDSRACSYIQASKRSGDEPNYQHKNDKAHYTEQKPGFENAGDQLAARQRSRRKKQDCGNGVRLFHIFLQRNG